MRRLERFASVSRNSLWDWPKVKNPLIVVLNFLVIQICKYLPSLALKNMLYRAIGVRVGKNAALGLGVQLDIFFPELIEIGDNAIIGYNATLLAHEFLVDEFRVGRVKIGAGALIGACSVVLPGVEVGEGAVVSALSLVNKDVPRGWFCGGVPIRKIKKLTINKQLQS
ncbi:MAG: acyltransferase [Candidatus Micrarchaeia archaeon]